MAFVSEGVRNAFVVLVVLSQVVIFVSVVVFVISVLLVSVVLVQLVVVINRGIICKVMLLLSDWTYLRSVELFLTRIRERIVPSIVGELIRPL